MWAGACAQLAHAQPAWACGLAGLDSTTQDWPSRQANMQAGVWTPLANAPPALFAGRVGPQGTTQPKWIHTADAAGLGDN